MNVKPAITLSSIALFAVLSACGNPAVDDPNYFSYRVNDGQLSGSYNPAGYSAERVQNFLKNDCGEKTLATYNETPADGQGLIAFTAVCAGGTTSGNGHVSIQS